MKNLLLVLTLIGIGSGGVALADGHKMSENKVSNEFVLLHPKSIVADADAYYNAVLDKVFGGAIPAKYAQLAALSASIAMKCEYCIPAHKSMAVAAGASEEEIKTAIAIAADVALYSSMLYGSEYDMEKFKKMFE